MGLEARNKLVPQMADYDRIGDQWVPYLMRFDRPSRNFGPVSTNGLGFRITLDKEGRELRMDGQGASEYRGVVLGASSVFGVGATSDAHTIPSVLNRTTSGLWLNFGGRAFNSTQELILLQLFLPKELDRIVVFSGANNITLAFLTDYPSPVYNSFFFQTMFERAMRQTVGGNNGMKDLAVNLMKRFGRRFIPERLSVPARSTLDDHYDQMLTCFRRDLRVLAALASGLGAQICFALQPLATWIDKSLSPEEEQLFRILDEMSMDWQVLAKYIGDVRDRYFNDIVETCAELKVPFANLNLAPDFSDSDWLFVDRVHLTDRGYALASELLKREFSL